MSELPPVEHAAEVEPEPVRIPPATHQAVPRAPDPFRSDVILRLAIALAVVMAGASVAYYFAVYLPARDARAHADAVAASAAQAANAAQSSAVAAADQDRRRAAYQACLANADLTYHATWNGNCADRATKQAAQLTNCLALGSTRDVCAATWPALPAADCTLPTYLSDTLDSDLKAANTLCLDQAKAGL
jgi:hypothetical protein